MTNMNSPGSGGLCKASDAFELSREPIWCAAIQYSWCHYQDGPGLHLGLLLFSILGASFFLNTEHSFR